MNELEYLFKQVSKITEVAKKRATEIFRVSYWKRMKKYRIGYVKFKEASIEVSLIEYIYESAENFVRDRVDITLEMLNMDDREWQEYMKPANDKMELEMKADAEKEKKETQEHYKKKLDQAQKEVEQLQKLINPAPAQNK